MNYFLVGIGGSGMAPLALLLRGEGHSVRGSDRALDDPSLQERLARLRAAGIELCAQDGSGPRMGEILVVSTAIERSNPDWSQAQRLGLATQHRSEVLAELFNRRRGIAVSGTSGKSTTTALLAHLLSRLDLHPSIMAGAEIHGLDQGKPAAAIAGSGELFVIEADESDGSFLRYRPEIGVITNISKDHMELGRLLELFAQFAEGCRSRVVLGSDCPHASALPLARPAHRFGVAEGETRAEGLRLEESRCLFRVAGQDFELPLPGLHNVKNALAAIAVARELGLPLGSVAHALASFRGLHRRFERVGEARGVRVIDDYAHNPDKLGAILATTANTTRWILFQPHGYGPTRFLLQELAAAFAGGVHASDHLLMLPIYDAGGTADRSISSQNLVEAIRAMGAKAEATTREEALQRIGSSARPGEQVLVLGARDPSLSRLARQLVERLAAPASA